MGVLVGFGQILEEVPEGLHKSLKSYELEDGNYAILLCDSVREEFNGAMKLGVSTMMSSHNTHLQEFVNAILASQIKIPIKPEWIALPARRRRTQVA